MSAGSRAGRTVLVGAVMATLLAACLPQIPATVDPSYRPTPTATISTSPSHEPTPTPTPTPTPSPNPTATPSPSPTFTARPTPTPRPTARPTARPTPSSRPTATPRPASRLVQHGPRTGDKVALTFDMGGRVGDALAIMSYLVDHRVHASIFMTGAMADNENTDAGRQVLALVEAHPDLFTLGNHSYTHRDFRDLGPATIRDELRRTETAIRRYSSQDLRPFFRPPNGGYDDDVLAAVGAAGYRYTVTWDIDTIDWRPVTHDPPGPTADEMVTKVLGNARSGSIVLMHLGGYKTLDALPRIVAGLREAGFDLVTLDHLLMG